MKERIQSILGYICRDTLEREEVISLSLLAALSGESIFLLGLPGVGKSMMARRLKTAFHNARSFEYLMSRFSTPDEIFGPVSISKLKDEDSYERITKGYLPESEIIFLDEIWKAGPAIQNSLLTVLNEKIYLNGNKEMKLPVKGIISASNELPAEGEGLEALWDRFLIRYIVEPLQDKKNFASLLMTQSSSKAISFIPLTNDDCLRISEEASKVRVAEEIIDIVYNIRMRMNKKMTSNDSSKSNGKDDSDVDMKFYVSDRRWKKAIGVMKTSAFLNKRTFVDFSDLLLLRHMIWNEESMISQTNAFVAEEVVSYLFKEILQKNKSSKRHATRAVTSSIFSPDNKHYVIQCDGFQLKIAISDYKKLKKTGGYYLASETRDEVLILMDQGQYAVQVLNEGYISINSFTYPLITTADKQISDGFLKEMGGTLEMIIQNLNTSIANNIFVKDSPANATLYQIINEYRKRLG